MHRTTCHLLTLLFSKRNKNFTAFQTNFTSLDTGANTLRNVDLTSVLVNRGVKTPYPYSNYVKHRYKITYIKFIGQNKCKILLIYCMKHT